MIVWKILYIFIHHKVENNNEANKQTEEKET